MKKFLISFLAIICLYSIASAQRIEIFGGYSLGSLVGNTPEIYPPYDTYLCTPMVSDTPDRQNGALTLGVNARILGNLSIGLSWTGLNTYSQPIHYYNNDVIHTIKQSSNTVMFNLKYEWFKFWKIRLYSRAGLGAVFYGEPEYSKTIENWMHIYDWRDGKPEACKRFAWQVSYLGVELRPIKWVGIFAEGGLGRQGALLAGLKVFL
ncbi:MAG: hypothetical protein K2F80_07165 [Muribaculaceae bacterium]|nr:hypothetical protein [Muribaculaceae bacterium]